MGTGDESWKGNSPEYQEGQDRIFGYDCPDCNNRGHYVARDTVGIKRVVCPCTKNPNSRYSKRSNK